MFRFQYPWFVLLVLALVAGLWLAWRRKPPALQVPALQPFRTGVRRGLRNPARWPLLLYGLGLLLCTIALMRPQMGNEQIVQRTEGIDIMLVLDVSGSMQSYDIPDGMNNGDAVARAIEAGTIRNRLQVAKEELQKFVNRRPDDRIGLIAFSRIPYMVCPPTLDHDFLINHLQTLEPGMLPDGTNIASPLASATYRLKDSPASRRVAVLFTDGQNNVEDRITPRQAGQFAKTFKITVYTVGIGSQRAVVMATGWFGRQLQVVQEGLDRKLLEEIAGDTGGRYLPARDAATFGQVMSEIDRLEKVKLDVPRYIDYRERFMPWLIAGLCLLLLAFVLENTLLLAVP